MMKIKWIFIVSVLFFSTGHTALAWFESSTNPIYDPIVATEKAYYPSVLKIGDTDYRMWYQSNSVASTNATIAYATSADGLSWTLVTNEVSGLLLNNAGHPHVESVDGTFRIWYWNAVTPYGNTAMHTAESVDGITWTNDTAITGDLISSTGGIWNSGSYGVVDVIINDAPTNTGTNPFDYKYAMYYDATSGGYEQIALGYSINGIAWTLYGTGPVLPKGSAGSWDSEFATFGTVLNSGGMWEMWYSGGISASSEGIGCATSNDGLIWTKCANNPIMSKNDGVAWRNSRTYTPVIIRDGGIEKMWFTGRNNTPGNYAIGYATLGSLGNVSLKKISSGESGLATGASDVVLNNDTVLNLSDTVNTVSNGTVTTGGVSDTMSNYTGGDLIGADLSAPKNIGGKSVVVGKAVKLSSGLSSIPIRLINSDLSSAHISIPDDTTIFAPSEWSGLIASPKTGSSSGDTAPAGFTLSGPVVDIGSLSVVILFDKPALVTLDGVTGSVGYRSTGETAWTQITATCGGTYDAPTISPTVFPGECSITNGTDTKILTYHLTTFGGLTAIAPTLATLHVIKLVVNGSGGTGPGILHDFDFSIHVKNSVGDVASSPTAGAAAPGTLYSLPADTYTISEDTNLSYVQSFSVGVCSTGTITLLPGDDKTCTMINTDIPAPIIPSLSQSSGGRSSNPAIVTPLIGILKIPSPLALPAGPGLVTYNYTVWNVGGQKALTDIKVTDDKCSPVTFLSGDLNNNSKLDSNENWKYQCTTRISTTTVNTASVIGRSDDIYRQPAIASMVSTVAVGVSSLSPLISIIKVPSILTPLPFGGGAVTYTYTVTNPGVVALNSVIVSDNKCGPVSYVSGDSNNDKLLDPSEKWMYTCRTNVLTSTRNVAAAEGKANGLTALSYAFANVLVSAPGLPNTGFDLANTELSTIFSQQAKALAINLGQGKRSNDVRVLQQFLISQNKGLAAQSLAQVGATAYFGILTRRALAEFQAGVGIKPAIGNFGPITRNYLKMNY